MSNLASIVVRDVGVLVVGAGLAGLSVALRLAPSPVTLITKTAELPSGSTFHAQGGIAVALADGDQPDLHAADTIAAGAGLVDAAMAAVLTREGPALIRDLVAGGVPFDTDGQGRLTFGREAAHGMARVVHAGGDATGRTVSLSLTDQVRIAPSVTVETGVFAVDLVVRQGRVCGLLAHGEEGWIFYRTAAVVLASGGIGQLFTRTTNPIEATGDGLALAARAGAVIGDVEFVQFHPTALAVGEDGAKPASLMTEALRGAGALLLDQAGLRFMLDEHPLAELAPRDVVARAIGRRIAAGEPVYLDLRPALAVKPRGFPTCLALCAEAGLDPWAAPVPIGPAAHYHMGGVVTDADGRTSIAGLWACGEVACTGVHGANRLASNSLLEALVFGARVAADIRGSLTGNPSPQAAVPTVPSVPSAPGELAAIVSESRRTLYANAGLVRDAAGLAMAERILAGLALRLANLPVPADGTLDSAVDAVEVRAWGEARNRLLVGRLIVHAAEARHESRGAHCRLDYPLTADEVRHSRLTLASLAPASSSTRTETLTESGRACPIR